MKARRVQHGVATARHHWHVVKVAIPRARCQKLFKDFVNVWWVLRGPCEFSVCF